MQVSYEYSGCQYLITHFACLLVCSFIRSFVILEGKIYDPADIAIVNKFNGVEENDLTDEVIEFFDGSKQDALDAIGDFP